jgi:hypothetical protein
MQNFSSLMLRQSLSANQPGGMRRGSNSGGRVDREESEPTFPVGGLVNHKVHLFMSGCLTLKCSGSWKTVTGSLLLEKARDGVSVEPLPTTPSGEIGMVSSGTGCDATSVMVAVLACEVVWRCCVRERWRSKGENAYAPGRSVAGCGEGCMETVY